MAPSKESDQLDWYRPRMRGILPLDRFNVPRSLKKFLAAGPFEIRINTAFEEVMRGCADRNNTWINARIIALYTELHRRGHAHSVECWRDGQLAGGLYGVQLGGAFFGESMFSRADNASKAALVALVERLNARGFLLLDAQYSNDHLKQFGVKNIPADKYDLRLKEAIAKPCTF